MRRKLDELAEKGAESWDEAREALDQALRELQDAWSRARDELR